MSVLWIDPEKPAGAGLDDFLSAVLADRWEALRWLVEELATVDARGEVAAATEALRQLSTRPRLARRVESAARGWWYRAARVPKIKDGTGPAALVIATAHPNGQIRQRAVEQLIHRPSPEVAPFLVLRTADWVPQVRTPARAWLATQLHDAPLAYLPTVIDMVTEIHRWERSSFATSQAWAAAIRVPRQLWDLVSTGPSAMVRRAAFDVTLRAELFSAAELITLAETDKDPVLRKAAAEAAVRAALWTGRVQHLRRLAANRRRDIRVLAVTGLVRAGELAEAAQFLDDPAILVRAVARDAARRLGTDALAHYRAQAASPEPPPGAIDGLAEIGTTADGPLLAGLLTHPVATVRARAVHGLTPRFEAPIETFIPLLTDESDQVVREATARLRPHAHRLPADLPWHLLANPHRPAIRRAGYKLLLHRPWPERLHAALLLIADPHPDLSQRALRDLRVLMWKARPHLELIHQLTTEAAQLLHTHFDPTGLFVDPETAAEYRHHLERRLHNAPGR